MSTGRAVKRKEGVLEVLSLVVFACGCTVALVVLVVGISAKVSDVVATAVGVIIISGELTVVGSFGVDDITCLLENKWRRFGTGRLCAAD